ncbi:hypothetical protein ACVWZW_002788 [Bradyrhizobium sp. F1.13.4]
MRTTAVRLAERIEADQSVVILVPRHELGAEQIEALHLEHPMASFTAAIWRGRYREDPEFVGPQRPGKTKLMCWRSKEAQALETALLDVESNLCKKGRGKANAMYCPFYFQCGAQRQKQVRADIWLGAHELMAHPPPKAFGRVARVMVDESPLDAFMFGVDALADKDKYEIDLDALLTKPSWFSYFSLASDILMDGRSALYQVLDDLQVPIDKHHGAPLPRQDVQDFGGDSAAGNAFERFNGMSNGPKYKPKELIALEWRDKIEPPINPVMSTSEVEEQLTSAAENPMVKKLITLWSLLGNGSSGYNGRIQLHRGEHGRVIRMTGLRDIAEGWKVPTLICDATGDSELLRAIWPQLVCEVADWQQLPRPSSVKVSQIVDRAISKWAVAVEGKGKELVRRERAARRLYAAVLMKALSYGGADVGVVLYKSTEDWIRKNCFVPDWLKLYHHGATEGTNALESVRALFVIGRPLASPEAVSRMAEALVGDYVEERDYVTVPKGGRIPIVKDAAGNNAVMVDVWRHRNRFAERLRRQITEGGLIQAAGRARAGLRGRDNPLDLHLWTDVALPELGEVTPVLWDDVAVGLDEQMLATGGVWLENVSHAARAYPRLFTADGLEKARGRGKFAGAKTPDIPNIKTLISNVRSLRIDYQLVGPRQQHWHAESLLGLNATRIWLEERLGLLAKFEAVDVTVTAEAG